MKILKKEDYEDQVDYYARLLYFLKDRVAGLDELVAQFNQEEESNYEW